MKVDERATGFSLNVKKDKLYDMKICAKIEGKNMSDITRDMWDNRLRLRKKEIQEFKEELKRKGKKI